MTRDEARRVFPSRIRTSLRLRGMKQRELAAILGVRDTTVSEWCRGIRFPSMVQAPGLAEHLESDTIAGVVADGHTVVCIVCGRAVIQMKLTRNPRYCSSACKATQHDRQRRGSIARHGVVAEHRRAALQQAVDDFCRQCEPEGVCRAPECLLRSHSPLPLIVLAPRRVA